MVASFASVISILERAFFSGSLDLGLNLRLVSASIAVHRPRCYQRVDGPEIYEVRSQR